MSGFLGRTAATLSGAAAAAALGLLLLAAAAWGAPRHAEAHAVLVHSEPAPGAMLRLAPASIDLWFSEPLEGSLSGLELLGADGRRLPLEGMRVDPRDATHLSALTRPLPPGHYAVAYRTLSALDGHDWSGSFTFTVLSPDGSLPAGAAFDPAIRGGGSAPEIAGRWLTVAGLVVVVAGGALLALAAPGRRRWRAGAPPPPLAGELDALARRLALAGVPLAAAGLVVDLQAQQQQLGAPLATLLLETRFGPFVAAQGLLTLASAGALALAWAGARRGAPAVERGATATASALALLALLALPLVSHAAAAPGALWAVLADAVHLAAASLWAGGLLALAAALARTRRLGRADAREVLPLAVRFSAAAGAAVAVVAVTGVVRALGEIPDAGALITDGYGRWLLAKLALVAAALALALRSRRALARLAAGGAVPPVLSTLRRGVPGEVALALLVLGAVAVLAQTPSPRAGEGDEATISLPYNSVAASGDLSVHLQVTPARAGPNEIRVHAYRADGGDPGEFSGVILTVGDPGLGPGGLRREAEPEGEGIFTAAATATQLSPAWTVSAEIRRAGRDDVRSDFRVPIEPPRQPPGGRLLGSPAPQLPANALAAVLLGGIGAAALGLAWGSRRRLGAPARAAAVAALTVAAMLWLSVDRHQATPALVNPSAGDPASVARGRPLYQQHCVACHGPEGRGDGPGASGLSPAPADLSLHVPLHPDADTFAFIARGFPGTAMQGWDTVLSEQQIWDLVNYLRNELAGTAR